MRRDPGARRSGAAAVLVMALGLTGLSPAQAAAPGIRVMPRGAGTGDTVSVIGVGFCAAAECSAVTVSVEARVAAAEVAVAPDGTFNIPVRIAEPAGEYRVTATQSGPGGRIGADTTLLVAVVDHPDADRPPQDYTAPPTSLAPPAAAPVTEAPGTPAPTAPDPDSTSTTSTPSTAPGGTTGGTVPDPGPASGGDRGPATGTDREPASGADRGPAPFAEADPATALEADPASTTASPVAGEPPAKVDLAAATAGTGTDGPRWPWGAALGGALVLALAAATFYRRLRRGLGAPG